MNIDFMKFLIPKDDKLLPVIEHNLTDLENEGLVGYKPKDRSKAIIHSWLAAQKVPGTPMGASITRKYLSPDSETCQVFINWLRRLFCD